jgi:hypothetical protein
VIFLKIGTVTTDKKWYLVLDDTSRAWLSWHNVNCPLAGHCQKHNIELAFRILTTCVKSIYLTPKAECDIIMIQFFEVHGGALGWGTALKAGSSRVLFPMVPLTLFFRPRYGRGVESASNRNAYQEYFLRCKGGRCVGLTTLPPSCGDCLEIWEPKHSGNLRASHRIALPLLLFLILYFITKHVSYFIRFYILLLFPEDGDRLPKHVAGKCCVRVCIYFMRKLLVFNKKYISLHGKNKGKTVMWLVCSS